MNARLLPWLPAAMLGSGLVLTLGIGSQRHLQLVAPLATSIPTTVAGYHSTGDDTMSTAEHAAVGVTEYLLRSYHADSQQLGDPGFTLYVGFYDNQTEGHTIHSPKNCLPGSGWEALSSTTAQIATAAGPVTVNRYLLQKHELRALVLYWYQGRGRVAWNEYRVKFDLLRDAALRRRSDEALVRIVVPVTDSEDRAYATAVAAARELMASVGTALPR